MAKQLGVKIRKGRAGPVFMTVMVILIAVALVRACTVFFRVETVNVEGVARYSADQIRSVSGVEKGDNLILTPSDQVAQRIYDELPYVDEVEIQKRFPTTLRVTVRETAPVAVISDGVSNWLIDPKGKLLEQADEAMAAGYLRVQGIQIIEPQQGQRMVVPESSEVQLEGLLRLLQVLQERGTADKITSIDASSRTEIIMIYDGRIQAKMLNNADFNRKIQVLEAVVAMIGEDEWRIIDMKTEKAFDSPWY